MQRKIHWGTLIATSFLALAGAACSNGAGPGEGQAHYHVYRPSSDEIPSEYAGTHCYAAYAGIGAEVPLRAGAGIGVPELPTGVERSYPKEPGGPVQDGQSRADGNGSYEVSCMVAGSGDGPYRISAHLKGANGSPYPGTNAVTSISIEGAVIQVDGKGTGQVTSYSFDSKGVQPIPGRTCALEVIPHPTTGKRLIGPGSAYLIFKCEGVTTDGEGSYCYSEGTVVLGNCERE
jgi:hypothetical protein